MYTSYFSLGASRRPGRVIINEPIAAVAVTAIAAS
jgi:hypothetical protein